VPGASQPKNPGSRSTLSAQDLISGSAVVHEIAVPPEVLHPRASGPLEARTVRLRPLTVGALAVISRAARDEPGLVPLLMIKESLVEPVVSIDQARQMHIGLVHFLVGEINQISGLTADGETHATEVTSPATEAHVLLARHFGWTPDQVAQLTPGQVMVYLAGIERLLNFERRREER
jgi:hypothetical protein